MGRMLSQWEQVEKRGNFQVYRAGVDEIAATGRPGEA
jgi:hypothetical protein